MIGLGVWHLIIPDKTPPRSSIGCECVFLGLRSRNNLLAESPDGTPCRNVFVVEKANKPLSRRRFASAVEVAPERPISRFARLEGFVIRCRSRTASVSPVPR